MIPAAFEYVRAGSAEEAIAALAEHGDEAKVLAGGHSLLPLMKLRLATPSVLVDVGWVRELSYIREEGDEIHIGGVTRHHDVQHSELLKANCGLLAHVASFVGDPQVRHRGTLGGSLAHADPASDLPAAVLALGGSFVLRGPKGERVVAASDFFQGFLETALAPDELLTEVRVPKMPGATFSYQKFVKRAQDWAIVGAAVVRNGHTGIALVNMGQTPIRASGVEAALASGASAADAAAVADEGTNPSEDLNASEEFRRHLSRVLVRRGLEEAGA
ncbi:MAG: Carbon monoxide dehydrogenase [Actinomycetia bacterium]|nr:Carbon monoxide dehydrogenase [Actinomycetes bacterium]